MHAIVGDDSDVEEDFPTMKLNDLLDDLKLDDD